MPRGSYCTTTGQTPSSSATQPLARSLTKGSCNRRKDAQVYERWFSCRHSWSQRSRCFSWSKSDYYSHCKSGCSRSTVEDGLHRRRTSHGNQHYDDNHFLAERVTGRSSTSGPKLALSAPPTEGVSASGSYETGYGKGNWIGQCACHAKGPKSVTFIEGKLRLPLPIMGHTGDLHISCRKYLVSKGATPDIVTSLVKGVVQHTAWVYRRQRLNTLPA